MVGLEWMVALLGQGALPEVALKPGLVIRQSCRVKPGTYWIKSAGEQRNQAAIRIEGKNIRVDLTGVILEGTPPSTEPDARKGLGILAQGDNIQIRGGHIRGYKVGLWAYDSAGLQVSGLDTSHNWKQRLRSTPQREDGADWMSYHKNEANEWLRFGAGIYLERVSKFTIDQCKTVGGQCGLMMTQSNDGLISNNNFSYLSAVGLGMYRSSRNRIMHNSLDYCVRGYSHGVYNRGQDSTGILIYEQSNNNVFAYNSATHGGDGFFLWAGQKTMDTGKGGCNDNLVYANDFSHSPCNAIEATFSRNQFVYNLLLESWHGIWGGYSYDSPIMFNVFGGNGEAIAIEHGQSNNISFNSFDRDTLGVYLWQNDRAPDPNWGYPKFRDTRNVGTKVTLNNFNDLAWNALLMGNGTSIQILNNMISNSVGSIAFDGKLTDSAFSFNGIQRGTPVKNVPGVNMEGNRWENGTPDSHKPIMTRGGNAYPAEDAAIKPLVIRSLNRWKPMDLDSRQKLHKRLQDLSSSTSPLFVEPLSNGRNVFLKADSRRGRSTIIVDEWGPFDYRYPKAVVRSRSKTANGAEQVVFDLIGPVGVVTARSVSGLKLASGQKLAIPGRLVATVDAKATIRSLDLEYVGEATVDYRGIVRGKGKPARFGWSESHLPIAWNVKFFAYDPAKQEPRTMRSAFNTLIQSGQPIHQETPASIDYGWGGALFSGGPANHFATVAEGQFSAQAGEYELSVTSDDGVAVWIDGKKVLENWTWHGPTVDKATVKLGGSHRIRVEHFEIDGYATLKVELVPKRSSQPLH